MNQAVDLYVYKNNQPLVPVEGVYISIYQSGVFVTSGSTDVNGELGVLLPDGVTYELRFYKAGYSFTQRQQVEVLASGGNSFEISAKSHAPPASTNPRYCIAHGTFMTALNMPAAYVDFEFRPAFRQLTLDGQGIITNTVRARTDALGYLSVPLIRHAVYDVIAEGMEDMPREVHVPDLPSTSLIELMFAVVTDVFIVEPTPVNLVVGASTELSITLGTSDGRVLTDISQDLNWILSDPTLVGIEISPTKIKLFGARPGTTTLTATRKDQTVARIPNTPLTGVPISIEVV